jgi:hypothetical protein
LTSPRRHPHWIFDKNAQFCRRDISIPLGFFWRPALQENSSPPFAWNEGLMKAVVARAGKVGDETPDAADTCRQGACACDILETITWTLWKPSRQGCRIP